MELDVQICAGRAMTRLDTTRAPQAVISCVSQDGKANIARNVSTTAELLGALYGYGLFNWYVLLEVLMSADCVGRAAVGKSGQMLVISQIECEQINTVRLLLTYPSTRFSTILVCYSYFLCKLGQSHSYKTRVFDLIWTGMGGV